MDLVRLDGAPTCAGVGFCLPKMADIGLNQRPIGLKRRASGQVRVPAHLEIADAAGFSRRMMEQLRKFFASTPGKFTGIGLGALGLIVAAIVLVNTMQSGIAT